MFEFDALHFITDLVAATSRANIILAFAVQIAPNQSALLGL
jgi:hypothetical protein